MGRPPSEKKQRQLAVALPPDTRAHLDATAKAGNRSVAEEMRRRIDKSIDWEKFDEVTMELLEGIKQMSALLSQDFGMEWHEHPRAHEAFKVAVAQRIAEYAPPPSAPSAAASDLGLVRSTDPPDTIGRMRERDDRNISGYGHLHKAQQRRATHTRLGRTIKAKKEGENE
jgi:hypothetical protein